MLTKQYGNSTITCDNSYRDSLTAEVEAKNLERLREACWSIIDELQERGEQIPA